MTVSYKVRHTLTICPYNCIPRYLPKINKNIETKLFIAANIHSSKRTATLHTYCQLVFDRGANNAQWGKDSLFNKWCWGNYIHMKKNWGPMSYYTKINSKWNKGLNIRPETIKLIKENLEEKFHDIGLGNGFMDVTPKAQAT